MDNDTRGSLIITRHPGEVLVLGPNHDIEIEVLTVRGNQVRLRIRADKSIPVDRAEVRSRKDRGLPAPAPRGLR